MRLCVKSIWKSSQKYCLMSFLFEWSICVIPSTALWHYYFDLSFGKSLIVSHILFLVSILSYFAAAYDTTKYLCDKYDITHKDKGDQL